MVGSLGRIGVFSFYGNKIVTTGEGGALVTDDPELAFRIRLLKGQGMDPERRYWFTEVGFNYRMTNVAAAIGVAQLDRFPIIAAGFRDVRNWYDVALSNAGIDAVLPTPVEHAEPVNWLYTLRLPMLRTLADRDALIVRLGERGIETRPMFHPLHRMPPYYGGSDHDWPVSSAAADHGISLPTSSLMSKRDVDFVVETLAATIGSTSRP